MTKLILIPNGEFFNFGIDRFVSDNSSIIYEESYAHKVLNLPLEDFLSRFIEFYLCNNGDERDLCREMYEVVYDQDIKSQN